MARASITGNATSDVELKFLNSGVAVANFSIAESYKPSRDKDEETYFWNVVVWNQLAENVAESVRKGQRVVVEGRLVQRTWTTEDDQKRSKVELVADSVGIELRFGTAVYTKRAAQAASSAPADDDLF
jgi:single-strand DNA-binding protein